MEIALHTNNLTKRYVGTRVPALDNLSLSIAKGEIYGFLGANGAGKSTTIRTLLNFIQPTGGSATILGLDIVRDSVTLKRHIGYLAGDVALYNKMTGGEFLDYMSALQPAKSAAYRHKLIKRFEAPVDKPIAEMSKGNRQKFGIIQAFMHQPAVLILDEPTSGLDPLMQEAFYETLREFKAAGACTFFSSHNLAEVQRICDRIGFIRGGKLVNEQSVNDLSTPAKQTFVVTFAGDVPLAELKRLHGTHVSQLNPTTAHVTIDGELSTLLTTIAKHKVTRLTSEEVSIEDEFMELYEGKS